MKAKSFLNLILSLGCLWFILQALIERDISSIDQNTQTAPKGMVLVSTDSLLPYYISVTEEPNIYWQTYIKWQKTVFSTYPEVYKESYPKDTIGGLWLQYNDPMIQDYSNHPAFQWYPVTGVSWFQVKSYLEWKTDRLNEKILENVGIIEIQMNKIVDDNNFNTEAYLNRQYDPSKGKRFSEFANSKKYLGNDYILASDGILFPQYRLPTEAEWEAGALFVDDKLNSDYILNSVNKTDFLDEWMTYFQVIQPYKIKKLTNADLVSNNFKGGVSEWLLDAEDYKQGYKITDYNMLKANGWRNFDESYPYDHYGEIREKDSIGRLPFRFVQMSSVNDPLYLKDPEINEYLAFQEFYPNPNFHKSEQYIDSLLKIDYYSLFMQVAHYYKNDFNEYIKYYGLRKTINTTDSLNKKTVYKWVKNNSELNRKYISSNYRYSTKSVAVLKQTKSLPLMGFRTVLPYTGVAVKKGYKVKW